MRSLRLLVILWLAAALLGAPVDVTKALDGFDAVVERGMKELQVPGAAVGAIYDGKVVLARGYGLRDVTNRLPVTPRTLFAIGSVTKSFTATLVTMEVDAGKLAWDRPVREYLPWFRLHDPIATELMTPRDLLTHRSGLPRHDFIRMAVPMPRQELVRRLRYLEPSRTFRETCQYQNLMYVSAGYLAGEVAGSTWEQLVAERIFGPLGMTRSNTSVADSQASDDFAKPYVREGGRVNEVPFYDYQRFGVGPNGAVNSSVEDMLKYLQFHMRGGKAGDRQLVSPEQMRQLHTPHVVSAPDITYALGWNVSYYRGRRQISHGGAITGFTAQAAFFPEDGIGIIVLNNLSGSGLPSLVAATLADRLLGLEPVDHLARARAVLARQARSAEEARKKLEAARVPNTKPSHELAAFAGEYTHPAYGPVRVEVQGEGLRVVFPALSFDLKHYHYDTFATPEGRMAQFQTHEAGKVASVTLPLEPAVKPLVFTRVR